MSCPTPSRSTRSLSYLIALVLPALDAIFPVLPSETASSPSASPPRAAPTRGSRCSSPARPRAPSSATTSATCSAAASGRAVERRFFATREGRARRAWAERSLDRFGLQLIVVCRFIPGGRTAVTLTCGLTGYPRRRFVAATAVAAVIWALYAFFIGRLGGRAFEHNPWAGLALAFGASIAISALIEVIRRCRSGRITATQARRQGVTPDRLSPTTPDRISVIETSLVTDTASPRKIMPTVVAAGGADPGPDRVGGSDRELAQRHGQQPEAGQRANANPTAGHGTRRPLLSFRHTAKPGLEQAGGHQRHPCHHVTSLWLCSGHVSFLRTQARNSGVPVMKPEDEEAGTDDLHRHRRSPPPNAALANSQIEAKAANIRDDSWMLTIRGASSA